MRVKFATPTENALASFNAKSTSAFFLDIPQIVRLSQWKAHSKKMLSNLPPNVKCLSIHNSMYVCIAYEILDIVTARNWTSQYEMPR
jgi:hypothetical protein